MPERPTVSIVVGALVYMILIKPETKFNHMGNLSIVST